MTLPFDIPDKNKKKYQCFVCGHKFDNYPEYKEHIIESHEEGREYILCPLARCGAPVRDVRMHFKAKHPNDVIPKKGQMSALIWKDMSPKGNSRTKKPNFKEGWYDSIKMSKKFYYRSGYEQVVYECLDVYDEVIGFEPLFFVCLYKVHRNYLRDYRS